MFRGALIAPLPFGELSDAEFDSAEAGTNRGRSASPQPGVAEHSMARIKRANEDLTLDAVFRENAWFPTSHSF